MEIPYLERERISTSSSSEVRRADRKAHRGSGHLAASKFLGVLRSGGPATAVQYANHWRCRGVTHRP